MLFGKIIVDVQFLMNEKPYSVEQIYKFKILLLKKCEKCNEKKLCTYIEVELDSHPYHSKNYEKYYCSECGKERRKYHEAYKEFLIEVQEQENKKENEARRLAFLKKEVERREIEEKAKLYGITYPGDTNI